MELGEQALQIRRTLFGEEHPETASSLSNVAHYYDALGKLDQALELGEQALQIRRTLFGEQHPDTANSLHNVALYYNALGNPVQAWSSVNRLCRFGVRYSVNSIPIRQTRCTTLPVITVH